METKQSPFKPLLFRQGDVLIEKVRQMPADARANRVLGHVVLARGEATGHQHEIRSPGLQSYLQGNALYFHLLKNSQVLHAEHDPIQLEPGLYRVVRQREFIGSEAGDSSVIHD